MKRLICVLLAVVLAVGSSVPAYAFLPPERLSESLEEKQDIAFETTVKKQSDKALSDAAVYLGKNLDGTITFSHYINKKTLTLDEFNAFRWSFIFSQFAHPFQDNLQTVFNQPLFQQMENQGLQLQSVAEALASVTEMDLAKIGTSGMMLQGSDYKKLKDTIVGNLYYMSVYNGYGGNVTINDIFFGSADAGQVFYVYDYVSPLGPEANDYYFDQARLGREGERDGNYEYKAFPCFVLNNVSMLYLQIAFGAYLKSQDMDYGTFQERWGTYNIYLDSYGNLCTYDGEKYVIFFPNFANSLFINSEGEEGREERVFAYNKWLSTAYSTSLRRHNTVQPSKLQITCLGGKVSEETEGLADGSTVKTVFNGYSAYYHTYVRPFEDKNVIKNSMIFIDPPEISPASITTMKENGVSIFQSGYDEHLTTAIETLAEENEVPMLKTLASDEHQHLSAFGVPSNDFGWWQSVKGTLSSPVNQDGSLGFGGSSGGTADIFPIMQSNVGVLKGQGFFTLPESMNILLKKTVWKFQGLGIVGANANSNLSAESVTDSAIGEFYSQNELDEMAMAGTKDGWTTSRRTPLAIMNRCYAVAMSWKFNQTIPNGNYFKSTVGQGDSKQYASTIMFIRDKLIDYGQDMDIYMSEPGMYIPEWKMFWTGDTQSLLDSIGGAIKDADSAAQGSWFTASNIRQGDSPDDWQVILPKADTGSSSNIWLPVTAPTYTGQDAVDFKKAQKDYATGANDQPKYPGCDEPNGGKRIKNFIKALKNTAVDFRWWGFTDSVSKTFESFEEFYGYWSYVCGIYHVDSEEMMLCLINIMQQAGFDWNWDGLSAKYFISQYYLLSRDNRMSNKLGANTIADMALATYFWDRYYMPEKMPMWGDLIDDIWANKDLVQDNLEEGRESFKDWSDMNVMENTAEEMGEVDGVPADDRNQTPENYIYKYLRGDDMIFLPFAASSTSANVRVYYTPHEELVKSSIYRSGAPSGKETEWDTWEGIELPNTRIQVNYHDYLMCLQKNTDYVHNYQLQPTIVPAATKNYSVEDLMTIAGEFATNPVSAIKYIISGMMFDAHNIFGIGPLGSSFDLNWITTNPIYLWLSSRYVSFLAALICIVIMIRIIRYLIGKRKDSLWALLKDCGLIMCVSLVPILVLNSFIWCFAGTSKFLLREASYKSLLYETQLKTAERINADAKVDTEIAIFKQQFSGLQGIYDGITFEYILQYDNLKEAPIYKEEAWIDMLENTKLQLNRKTWYDKDGFVPVHRELYDKSTYYFFYDYMRSSMLNYYSRLDGNSWGALTNLANTFDYAGKNLASMPSDQQRALMLNEQAFAMSRGGFRNMLRDTEYIYGESILLENEKKYDKPYLRDIFGTYMLFEDPSTAFSDEIIQTQVRKSGYWQTWVRQNPMTYFNRTFKEINPSTSLEDMTWVNPEVIQFELGREQLYTSILDAYNPAINPSGTSSDGVYLNQHSNPVELSKFETKLTKTIEQSYDEIMSILNLMPDQISDETAISVAAIVLTCNMNDMMGVEPSMPILSSMNMDMLLRTVLIRNIEHLEGGINLLYGLLDEGFGLIGVAAVILFEILVAILFVLRVGLIISTMLLSLTYAIVQFGFKDFNYRRKLLIGCISQYIGTFLLHTGCLITVYGMAHAISFLHAVPVIGTLGVMALAIVAFIFLGAMHIKLWKVFLADWQHLGGALIQSMVSGKIQELKSKFENIRAKFDRTSGLTESQESEVSNAVMNVAESHEMDVGAVNTAILESASNVTGLLNAAEQLSSSKLWDETQIPPTQIPHLVESQVDANGMLMLPEEGREITPDGTVVLPASPGHSSRTASPGSRHTQNIIDVEYTEVKDVIDNLNSVMYPTQFYGSSHLYDEVQDLGEVQQDSVQHIEDTQVSMRSTHLAQESDVDTYKYVTVAEDRAAINKYRTDDPEEFERLRAERQAQAMRQPPTIHEEVHETETVDFQHETLTDTTSSVLANMTAVEQQTIKVKDDTLEDYERMLKEFQEGQ